MKKQLFLYFIGISLAFGLIFIPISYAQETPPQEWQYTIILKHNFYTHEVKLSEHLEFFQKKKNYYIGDTKVIIPIEKSSIIKWFTAFAITWGSCVALSRVILGAHFLSDVIVGGYIALILFYLFKGWLIIEPNAQRVTAS